MNKPLVFALVLTAALLAGCANQANRPAAHHAAPAKVYNSTCTHGFDACHVKADAECRKMGYKGHDTVNQDDAFFGNNIDYTCTK